MKDWKYLGAIVGKFPDLEGEIRDIAVYGTRVNEYLIEIMKVIGVI